MNLHVRHYQGYGEVVVSEGNSQFETGFLDVQEREKVAEQLLNALVELVRNDFESEEEFVAFVKERL